MSMVLFFSMAYVALNENSEKSNHLLGLAAISSTLGYFNSCYDLFLSATFPFLKERARSVLGLNFRPRESFLLLPSYMNLWWRPVQVPSEVATTRAPHNLSHLRNNYLSCLLIVNLRRNLSQFSIFSVPKLGAVFVGVPIVVLQPQLHHVLGGARRARPDQMGKKVLNPDNLATSCSLQSESG